MRYSFSALPDRCLRLEKYFSRKLSLLGDFEQGEINKCISKTTPYVRIKLMPSLVKCNKDDYIFSCSRHDNSSTQCVDEVELTNTP